MMLSVCRRQWCKSVQHKPYKEVHGRQVSVHLSKIVADWLGPISQISVHCRMLVVPLTPSWMNALCSCAFILSPSPLSHPLRCHKRVTRDRHDEDASQVICFVCSIKARILAYSAFSPSLVQGPKSGRLLAVTGVQYSHCCAPTAGTQQYFLISACEISVVVSCREARGAGPLAVSGFQDLKSHSVWYDYGHKALALGALYIINKGLAVACKRAGITFPSPLIGQPISARLQDGPALW